jgi:hypothetical protein
VDLSRAGAAPENATPGSSSGAWGLSLAGCSAERGAHQGLHPPRRGTASSPTLRSYISTSSDGAMSEPFKASRDSFCSPSSVSVCPFCLPCCRWSAGSGQLQPQGLPLLSLAPPVSCRRTNKTTPWPPLSRVTGSPNSSCSSSPMPCSAPPSPVVATTAVHST